MGETIGTKPLVGRTVLKFNSATMYQAVEDYLRNKVFQESVSFKVESIALTKEGQCPSWNISIQEEPCTP